MKAYGLSAVSYLASKFVLLAPDAPVRFMPLGVKFDAGEAGDIFCGLAESAVMIGVYIGEGWLGCGYNTRLTLGYGYIFIGR